jgi:hypothetical protein
MKSTVATTLILAGAAMVLVPLGFSYSYHGQPPQMIRFWDFKLTGAPPLLS